LSANHNAIDTLVEGPQTVRGSRQ